ncbi:transposase [Streptococcus anginosus]|uniref:RNA-guided endonuclease InsQ/TnpB family protein n=1 Tax=Streptococcus anginosus TaxID=1328 RepID=UPI002220669F|nr:transposase [Streptococcus anginosus]MCW0986921.1 transposase [Streptococcus anginosus]
MSIYKNFEYRVYPTDEQKKWFEEHFEVNRFLYNHLLSMSIKKYNTEVDERFLRLIKDIDFYSEKIQQWTQIDYEKLYKKAKKGVKIYSKNEFSKLITKAVNNPDFPWVNKSYDGRAMREVATSVDTAYKNFFKGKDFPRFKKKYSVRTLRFPVSKQGEWYSIRFESDKILVLPKKIKLRIVQHRPFEGEVIAATIKKAQSGKWFVTILSRVDPPTQLIKTGDIIVLNRGVREYMIGYDSNHKLINYAPFVKDPTLISKINKLHKKLSQKYKSAKQESRSLRDSKNYQKNKESLARLYEKLKFQKEYYLQQLSRKIIEDYDLIILESLSIKELASSNIGEKVKSGERIVQRRFSKKIMGMSHYRLETLLKEKAELYGKRVVMLPKGFNSNGVCSECGTIFEESIPLNNKEFICPNCNIKITRGENSVKNILREGMKYL